MGALLPPPMAHYKDLLPWHGYTCDQETERRVRFVDASQSGLQVLKPNVEEKRRFNEPARG